MKILSILLALIFCSALPLSRANAQDLTPQKEYLQLSDGVERYVEYTEPKPGMPWIVFTNGLVYELGRWRHLDSELRAQGYGILHYYMRGQDLTLRQEVKQHKTPLFFKTGLQPADFAHELDEILTALEIQDRVVVVGLSFGAGAAAAFAEEYPNRIEQLILLAPLVVPLEQYQPYGIWLDWNLEWVRLMWGPMFYEYAYRQIYRTYLETRVTPDRVPSSLRDIPEIYRESLFHLVRSVHEFDLKKSDFSKLKKNSVFFMVAQEEEPKAFEDQLKAFERVDKKVQGNVIWLPNSSHAIPDSEPVLAGTYIHHWIQRDARLKQGQKYKHTSEGLAHW